MNKPTATTVENMKDRRAQLSDLRDYLSQIEDDLSAAECCETPTDFDANIKAMEDAAKRLLAEIKEIRS